MITQKEAEELAKATIENYVSNCHCGDAQDIADVLMKLASMCGLAMCAVVGHIEASERMQDTAKYISEYTKLPKTKAIFI